MNWIDSDVQPIEPIDAKAIILKIEKACRTCYRSEDKIKDGSAEGLIRGCINRGHESVLEHGSVSFRIICDRGVSHEIVRHRIASYSQESTRYCNYGQDKFKNELQFIYPWWWYDIEWDKLGEFELHHMFSKELMWWDTLTNACQVAETQYLQMLADGAKPDAARAVLPNCLKTEIVMTANMRELRHFIKLRTSLGAHPDIRRLAIKLLKLLRDSGLGLFFEDITEV